MIVVSRVIQLPPMDPAECFHCEGCYYVPSRVGKLMSCIPLAIVCTVPPPSANSIPNLSPRDIMPIHPLSLIPNVLDMLLITWMYQFHSVLHQTPWQRIGWLRLTCWNASPICYWIFVAVLPRGIPKLWRHVRRGNQSHNNDFRVRGARWGCHWNCWIGSGCLAFWQSLLLSSLSCLVAYLHFAWFV